VTEREFLAIITCIEKSLSRDPKYFHMAFEEDSSEPVTGNMFEKEIHSDSM
jgi:hypothetical protein